MHTVVVAEWLERRCVDVLHGRHEEINAVVLNKLAAGILEHVRSLSKLQDKRRENLRMAYTQAWLGHHRTVLVPAAHRDMCRSSAWSNRTRGFVVQAD